MRRSRSRGVTVGGLEAPILVTVSGISPSDDFTRHEFDAHGVSLGTFSQMIDSLSQVLDCV